MKLKLHINKIYIFAICFSCKHSYFLKEMLLRKAHAC